MVRLATLSLAAAAVVAAARASAPHAALVARPRCGAHGSPGNAADTSRIYYDRDVDQMATADAGNPAPKWPGASYQSEYGTVRTDMRDATNASVIGRFVVDTAGCVDSSSFQPVTSSDSAFTTEVRRVLPRLRYRPATKDGHKVRSWVLWKFEFFRRNGVASPISP